MQQPAPESDPLRAAGEYFTVQPDGPRLRLRRRWFGPRFWGHLAWFAMTVLCGLLFTRAHGALVLLEWVFWCAAAIHGYCVLAYALNDTRVEVDDTTLVIRLGPIPWWSGGRWAIDDLEKVYVKDLRLDYSVSGNSPDVHHEYDLRARLRNGHDLRILDSAALDRRTASALQAVLQAQLRPAPAPSSSKVG